MQTPRPYQLIQLMAEAGALKGVLVVVGSWSQNDKQGLIG